MGLFKQSASLLAGKRAHNKSTHIGVPKLQYNFSGDSTNRYKQKKSSSASKKETRAYWTSFGIQCPISYAQLLHARLPKEFKKVLFPGQGAGIRSPTGVSTVAPQPATQIGKLQPRTMQSHVDLRTPSSSALQCPYLTVARG